MLDEHGDVGGAGLGNGAGVARALLRHKGEVAPGGLRAGEVRVEAGEPFALEPCPDLAERLAQGERTGRLG